MRCTENCNTCCWHWSTESVQFSMKTPNCMSHNQYSKSWTNCSMKFCLICHIRMTSPQLLTLLQASQQLFAGKMLLQPAEGRKFFPSVHQIPKRGYLCYRINKLISHWQTVLIIMIPILMNKDVFEPSNNDLKFTIWNCNYFFINLIVCQRHLRIAHLLLQQTSEMAPKMTSAKISNVTGSDEWFMPQRIVRSIRTICHQIVEPNSWVWNQKGRRDEGITEMREGKSQKSPAKIINTADWGTVTHRQPSEEGHQRLHTAGKRIH